MDLHGFAHFLIALHITYLYLIVLAMPAEWQRCK